MDNKTFPITPPPERFKQWEDDILNERDNVDHVLDCAWRDGFRAGADAELEACCEYMQHEDFHGFAKELRAARRPNPPILKEQANSITFQEGPEVIRIDAKGFHYYGQFIEDAGEAHRLLVEFLRKHQPDSDWHHAE